MSFSYESGGAIATLLVSDRVFQTPYYPSDDFCKRSNEPEYQMFLSRAIAAGKTPAVYGREVLLRSTPKVVGEINRQAWGDLGKALSNLNQLTRAINTLKLEDIAIATLVRTLLA